MLDPYRRWRAAVHIAGAVVVCLLAAAILISLILCVLGMFLDVGRTPA